MSQPNRLSRLAAILVAANLLLAGCSAAAIAPSDLADSGSFLTWGCSLIGATMPYVLVLALILGTFNIILWGIAQFGAGVVPGGMLSWTQQNMPNVIKGTLALIILPTLFLGIGGAAMGIDVAGCTINGGAEAALRVPVQIALNALVSLF